MACFSSVQLAPNPDFMGFINGAGDALSSAGSAVYGAGSSAVEAAKGAAPGVKTAFDNAGQAIGTAFTNAGGEIANYGTNYYTCMANAGSNVEEIAKCQIRNNRNAPTGPGCSAPVVGESAEILDCISGAEQTISSCPSWTSGDNALGSECFMQESDMTEGTCQESCKKKHPNSVGVTESTAEQYPNGKNKCWCEFGCAKLNSGSSNYRTCMFPTN